jgi:hypothetical protein
MVPEALRNEATSCRPNIRLASKKQLLNTTAALFHGRMARNAGYAEIGYLTARRYF